jgi:hypothetical protein
MHKYTFAPLPSFKELFLAVIMTSVKKKAKISPWCREEDYCSWFSRSAWSLLAIVLCRIRRNHIEKPCIWIPDFFCNSSLQPLRRIGIPIVFYPITNNLEPDIKWCQMASENRRLDIFVHVHYFGQPKKIKEVVSLCKEKNAWLVEDAAHVLRPIDGIGNCGDFVLFSPHKHLPIPDGALLILRTNGPSMLGNDEKSISDLSMVTGELYKTSSNSTLAVLFWVLKRFLQILGLRGKEQIIPAWPDQDFSNNYFKYIKMSGFAKRLLSLKTSQKLDEIAHSRKTNLKIWERNINKITGEKYVITQNTFLNTPYFASFTVENLETLSQIFAKLQIEGYPVTTWPDLPPEVLTNSEEHETAISIRKSRFYLAVHHTLGLNRFLD